MSEVTQHVVITSERKWEGNGRKIAVRIIWDVEWDYSTCSDVYQCVHLEGKNYQFDINEWLEWQLIHVLSTGKGSVDQCQMKIYIHIQQLNGG